MVYKVLEGKGNQLTVVDSFRSYQEALSLAEEMDAKNKRVHIHFYLAGVCVSRFWDNAWRFARKRKTESA